MKYLEFKIGEKDISIELNNKYNIEPTLINKIGPMTINTPHPKLFDGLINYKGKMVDVIDIAPLYEQEKLKKFDGLIFIESKEMTFAIKYEGFHKVVLDNKNNILNLDELVSTFTDFKS